MYRSFVRLSILAASAGLVACQSSGSTTAAPRRSTPDSLAIRRDIEYLASPALAGRLTGTPGNDRRGEISRAALRVAGPEGVGAELPAAFRRSPAGAQRSQPVAPHPERVRRSSRAPTRRCADSTSSSARTSIISARSTDGALDPDVHDAVRRGADDNASGTAAVLELARLLARLADQTLDHLRQLLRRRRGTARLIVLRRSQPGSARQHRRDGELRHGRSPRERQADRLRRRDRHASFRR